MIDNGIVGDTIDLVINAINGKLDFDDIVETGSRCCMFASIKLLNNNNSNLPACLDPPFLLLQPGGLRLGLGPLLPHLLQVAQHLPRQRGMGMDNRLELYLCLVRIRSFLYIVRWISNFIE